MDNDENGQFITIVRSIVDKEFYERCRGVTSPLYSIPDPRIAALEAALAAAQAKIAGNAALMAKLVEDAAILLNERDEARAALKEAVARAVIAVKGGE